MAKKIKEIHDQVNLLTAKGRTGYHSPEQIDLAIYKASKEKFNEYYKIYEQDNQLSDSMDVFLSDPISLTLTSGKYTLPVDFVHEVGEITSGTTGRTVKRLTHSQLAYRRNSSLVPPSADYPICTFYKTYIQFYPTDITNVKMVYLKKPVAPKYAYTIVSGRPVYDDANSIDVEWNDVDIGKIATKALVILGINLDDPLLVQYATNNETKDE